jgi:hypothetical protein
MLVWGRCCHVSIMLDKVTLKKILVVAKSAQLKKITIIKIKSAQLKENNYMNHYILHTHIYTTYLHMTTSKILIPSY